MATTFTDGVYDNTRTKTVNSSLSLSGTNAEVVINGTGNVTALSGFGILYNDTGSDTYGPATTITLDSFGLDTTFNTKLSAEGTEFALVDANGLTVTYTLTAGETTLFADVSGVRGGAVGPERRRKRLLGY